jgi:arginase family enzyme
MVPRRSLSRWEGRCHCSIRRTSSSSVGVPSRRPSTSGRRSSAYRWRSSRPTRWRRIQLPAAARALEVLVDRTSHLVVHFDADVIDFTDAPLSENPGRNEGLAYEDVIRALEVLVRSPRVVGLTLTG